MSATKPSTRDLRFQFGANWAAFLAVVDRSHIERAKQSLRDYLGLESLEGKTFLDVGSGSGLFSLAAQELGATVFSFDYDPKSVECTRELRRRFASDSEWKVEQGSILDQEFLSTLGTFDIVYSWGVLHHTGQMWKACENIVQLVSPQGLLFVALYNSQGRESERWCRVKRAYNSLPSSLRFLVLWPAFARLWGPTTVRDLLRGRPFRTWKTYASENRGMNPWYDVVDWVGGYPFEVATPDEVSSFFTGRGFELVRLKSCGSGRGCNEFVFRRQ